MRTVARGDLFRPGRELPNKATGWRGAVELLLGRSRFERRKMLWTAIAGRVAYLGLVGLAVSSAGGPGLIVAVAAVSVVGVGAEIFETRRRWRAARERRRAERPYDLPS